MKSMKFSLETISSKIPAAVRKYFLYWASLTTIELTKSRVLLLSLSSFRTTTPIIFLINNLSTICVWWFSRTALCRIHCHTWWLITNFKDRTTSISKIEKMDLEYKSVVPLNALVKPIYSYLWSWNLSCSRILNCALEEEVTLTFKI